MKNQSTRVSIRLITGRTVSLEEFISYAEIKPGYLHFSDGSYFPEKLPGLTVDGVYIEDGWCLSSIEREGKTTKGRAKRFCSNRNVLLPPQHVRDVMMENRPDLNRILGQIGWAKLYDWGSYWAKEDEGGRGEAGTVIYGTMPGDDIYLPGSLESYEYYVRGVIRVSKAKISALWDSTRYSYSYPAFLKAAGITLSQLDDMRYGRIKYPKPGDYRLTFNRWSSQGEYNEELGIYVCPNEALSLDVPAKLLTQKQAEVYCKAEDKLFPTLQQISLLEKHAVTINQALANIGMSAIRIPDEPLKTCWYQELIDEGKVFAGEKRRLYVFDFIENVNPVLLLLVQALQKLGFNF